MTDFALGQTFDIKFTTKAFATNIPTTLAGTPVIDIYEDNDTTEITGAETLSVDFDGITGLNNLRIVATSGNGFEYGKSYAAVITTGTVDGVSVVGEVVAQFTIGRATADVTAVAGTAQRATDLAEIAQYLFANSATLTDIIADDSVLAQMLASGGDISDYDDTTDSQEAIANSVSTASGARYAPDASSTITTGNQDSGTYESCLTDDGTKWTIGDEDGSNTIEVICEFNMGESRTAFELNVNGYYNRSGGGGYKVFLYAYNYTTSAYDALQAGSASLEMRDRSSDKDYVWVLDSAYTDVVATPGEVKIKFMSDRETTASGDVLYLDYVSVVGQSAASVSPQAVALAVHDELDYHLTHIPCFTGEIRYVSKSGDDGNSGHVPDLAFLTLAAAIAASAAGDRIIVKAGTYDEDGLDINLAGLELICEIGTILKNTNPGTVLTVSANSCIVCCALIEPSASQIGLLLSGSYCRIDDTYPHVAGATSFSITGEHNVLNRCRADNYSGTGYDIANEENILSECIANGAGTATRGFYLSHTNTHDCLLNACVSNNNDTAGYELVSGADNNIIQNSTSNSETTPYTNNGTGNTIGVNSTGTIQTDVAAVLVDTNELQTDLTDGGRLDLIIDLILEDTGTTLPATLAALNDITVANILAGVVEGSLDLKEVLRIILAVSVGQSTGAKTAIRTFRDVADAKARVTAGLDANGNRTSITLDGSD